MLNQSTGQHLMGRSSETPPADGVGTCVTILQGHQQTRTELKEGAAKNVSNT